ncbi:MAG: Hsp20/alpha crystallin family protein [Promethearchaeota archaeon]
MKSEKQQEEDSDLEIETVDDPDIKTHFPHWMSRMHCSPYGHDMRRIFIKKYKESKKARRMRRHAVLIQFEEEGDKTVMYAVLPGLNKSNLSVKAKKRAILIEGEYLIEAQRIFGEKISRRIRIPFEIDPENIDASYNAGILKIVFLGIIDPAVPIEVASNDE